MLYICYLDIFSCSSVDIPHWLQYSHCPLTQDDIYIGVVYFESHDRM